MHLLVGPNANIIMGSQKPKTANVTEQPGRKD